MAKFEKVDAVIVGAGAAGGIFAERLLQAGKSIVMLEAGPKWSLDDLYSSGLWARRLKWGGAPVLRGGEHPVGHNVNTGWGTGGAALHHYATWPRFSSADFRMKSLYGKALDWPISYDDLRPWYDRVQREVGISGDATAEVWREAGEPYPMPPLKVFRHAELLAKGFHALGMRTAPLPVAINSVPYNNGAACVHDGWCDAGCPIGAVGANPLCSYLGRALDKGLEVRHRCTAARVLTNAKGRATGVEYHDERGSKQIQAADVVILAASTLQNPRILLNSVSVSQPRGLANANGLVGRYFMVHSLAMTYAMFAEETENHMGVMAGQLTCRDGYPKDQRPASFGSYHWQIGIALKPNDIFGIAVSRPDIIGPALPVWLKRATRHLANMVALGEGLPVANNRIELASERDAYGLPLARAIHTFAPESAALFKHMEAEGLAVSKAAGAAEAWSGPPLATGHLVGGTIMGDDPRSSVCNSYGQTHEVPNLILSGPGLFPTSGGVNPTFTMHAVTLRGAEHLVANWARYV